MAKLILWLLFCVALAVFVLQNNTPIHLQFLAWKTQNVSLSLLVIGCTAAGVFLGILSNLPTHHRRRRQLLEKQRELDALKDSLTPPS